MENTYSEKINSTQYWDQRFLADWKENNGIEQSQFFSRIAVDNLPPWFIHYIKQHQPTFCDWGCAMGNGTRMLHELLSLKNITGIDFSEVAVEQARSTYPTIPFIATDIVKDEHFPPFDIIFTSNTLEHFENPWEILEKLSCYATKFIVILIPFQEYNRHFEHFYTFDTTNIPSTLRASHYLTHFSIFNAAEYPASLWNGHQILLIYSTYSELPGLGLTLSDLVDEIEPPPPVPETQTADTTEIRVQQERLAQNISQLKERLDLTFNVFTSRFDGTDHLIATSLSEKETLSIAVESLRNEILIEKKETIEKLLSLNANLQTAVQYLQNEMMAGKEETAEKLLLITEGIDAIRENQSRGLITRIRDIFRNK